MKNSSIIVGALLLLLNIIIGLLTSSISTTSLIISSSVIFFTFALNFLISVLPVKDGFKVSLPFFMTFMGIIEYVLSFFLKDAIKDNGFFTAIVILAFIQIILLAICVINGKSE